MTNDARMIEALGRAFTNVIREAQGLDPLPEIESPETIRQWLRNFMERRRLFNAAMDRRIAELENELKEKRHCS